MKKAAIFDMDGTLLDTEKFYAEGWLEVAKRFGQAPDPMLPAAMSGTSISEMPGILAGYYPEVDAKAYIDAVFDYVRQKKETEISLMAGVGEILDFFQAENVPMAVASSSFHGVVEANLTTAGIRDYFRVLVGGDQVKNGKPDPEIFIRAAEELGGLPEQCYIFEDSFNGIRAAHAAGGTAVMVPDQVPPDEEIRELCEVYESFHQFLRDVKAQAIA